MKYHVEYRGGLDQHDQEAIDALMKSLALEDVRVPRNLNVMWKRSDLRDQSNEIVASMHLSDSAYNSSVRFRDDQLHDPTQFDELRRQFNRSLRKLYLDHVDAVLRSMDDSPLAMNEEPGVAK